GARNGRRNVLEGNDRPLGRLRSFRPGLLPAHRRLVQRDRARVLPHHRLPDRPDDPRGPHHLRHGRDPLPLHRPGRLRRPHRHHHLAREDGRAHAALDLQGAQRRDQRARDRGQGDARLCAHQRGRHAQFRRDSAEDAPGAAAVGQPEPSQAEDREGSRIPPRAAAREEPEAQVMHFDALVIGAGFAGLYQLHCLRDRLGLRVRVLEAGGDIGGTWYWNRYPGARCDSESHAYRYFFSRELNDEWQSSERYPGPPEIRAYLNHVAAKFDLRRDIRFGARVTAAHFDDAANRWRIETESGEKCSATYLVTAVGCLSAANVPAIEGLSDFGGKWYHTGEWPHEGVDLAGKRVGQVGTGSTGIQAAPVIAQSAAHLTVFQRTANYSVPARNAPLTPEFNRWVRENYDEIRE